VRVLCVMCDRSARMGCCCSCCFVLFLYVRVLCVMCDRSARRMGCCCCCCCCSVLFLSVRVLCVMYEQNRLYQIYIHIFIYL
jgi:hypothetical protein